MWRKDTARLLILPLMSVVLVSGCATLTQKTTQRIPVTSSPAGATVSVNGVLYGVTPYELRLARKEKGQIIRIESPGYNPVEIRLKRKPPTLAINADAFLGGALGTELAGSTRFADLKKDWPWILGVGFALPLCDVAFGKKYLLIPRDITLTLTKADGTSRVDTVLIDAEDFQNVRWIRVHRD